MISQIDEHIAICDVVDVPESFGFDAILNLAADCDYEPPAGVEYIHIGINDDNSNDCGTIHSAAMALVRFASRDKKVLCHCRSGISRTPCIVAMYYVMAWKARTLEEAWEMIKAKRDFIRAAPAMWANMKRCL